MGPGSFQWSNVLDSALPPQRLRPYTWPEHRDPASHTAQKKRKREKHKNKKMNKQNPRTKGKSKYIQTKITQRSIYIHTH